MSVKKGDTLSFSTSSTGDSVGMATGVLVRGEDSWSSGWISGDDSCSLGSWTRGVVSTGRSKGVGRDSLSVVVTVVELDVEVVVTVVVGDSNWRAP